MVPRNLIAVAVVLLLISGLGAATGFTSTDMPSAYVGPNSQVPVFQFTLTDGGDTTIAGTAPADGTPIVATKDAEWTLLYYYDAVSGGAWDSAADMIFNDDGNVYYDQQESDVYIAGLNTLDDVAGSSTEPTGWNLYYYDAVDANGQFNPTEDWIGLDDDSDGVYTPAADTIVKDGTATPQPGDPLSNDWTNVYYSDANGNAAYDNGEAIISSADTALDSSDVVITSGSAALTSFPATTKHVDDGPTANAYDDGEAIVDGFTDGDNDGYYDLDVAVGVSITSGTDISTWTTTNPYGGNISYNDADANGKWSDTVDTIVIDIDNDGLYDAAGDILIGASINDQTNISSWPTTNPWTGMALRYNDAGTAGVWEPASDTVVWNTDDASETTATYQVDSIAVTIYGLAYAGDKIVAFAANEYFIDDNGNAGYEAAEAIINSADTVLDAGPLDGTGTDKVLRAGAAKLSNNWGVLVHTGTTYDDTQDIIDESVDGELTYSAAADTTVAGTAPAGGTPITPTKDADWTLMYYYDNGDGIWDPAFDLIFNDDGNVYYDAGVDALLAGTATDNAIGSSTEPTGWNLYYYDAVDANGQFNPAEDWIGLDADSNGVYRDLLNDVAFTNSGTAADADISLTLYQGTTCSGTGATMVFSVNRWVAQGAPLNWPIGTYTLCAIAKSGATDGATIQMSIGAGGITHAGSETLPASATTNANAQTLDVSAPAVSANPSSQTWTNTNIDVVLSATDVSGVAAIYYYETDSSLACPAVGDASYASTTTNPYTYTISTEGSRKLCVYAQDSVGNVPSAATEFSPYQLDVTAPTVSIGSPSNGGYYNSLTSISGTSSDSISGISAVRIQIFNSTHYWDGTQWVADASPSTNAVELTATGTTSWTYDSSGVQWEDGKSYTVVAIAYDNAGNTNTASSTFTYDVTQPQVVSITVNDNKITEGDVGVTTFTIYIDYSEPMDTTVSPVINIAPLPSGTLPSFSGSWVSSTRYTYSSSVADGNEEIYGINVSVSGAVDLAGNVQVSGSSSGLFDVDTVAPTVSITYPAAGAHINQSTVPVSWATSENYYSRTEIDCDNDGTPEATVVNQSGAYSCSYAADGAYTASITSYDDAGNSATATVSFTVDTAAPDFSVPVVAIDGVVTIPEMASVSISASSITDANIASGLTVTLDVYNESGAKVYSTSASGVTTSTQTFTIDMSSWSDGGYVAVITVSDQAGNSQAKNTTFIKFTKTMSQLSGLLDDSATTQLNQISDWTSVSNVVFATSFGRIEFPGPINFTDPATQQALFRLGNYFNMTGTMVSIDAASNALRELNKTATITLYDYENYGITTPAIFMDGNLCPPTVCSNIDASQSALGGDAAKRDLQFTVAHWTNYSIDETSGPKMLYAYAVDTDGDGVLEAGEKVSVVFNETVELSGTPSVTDIFALENGTFGTSPTMAVSGSTVEITLGTAPSVSHTLLSGVDAGASAIRVKEGQTGLVRSGTTVPAKAGMEDIATKLLQISPGSVFSVPYCVDSSKMIEKSGNPAGTFSKYTNGKWEVETSFKPLIGYKYTGTSSFDMPVYTYSNGCEISEIKTTVSNDWNLLGVNRFAPVSSGDWLWSLTKKSSTDMFVGAIYDRTGALLGAYNKTAGTFMSGGSDVQVSPYTAYWIPYAGRTGDMFFGVVQ